MKLLIVEDEYLARAELSHLLKKDERVSDVLEADSIAEATKLLLSNDIAIAYLDIHLSDESGMDLADMLMGIPNPPVIVFATAYDHYAIQAFEKNATDYILKPFEEKRVQQSLDKAIDQLKSTPMPAAPLDTVPVSADDKIHILKINSIEVIEAVQGKTVIQTGSKTYESTETLLYWEEKTAHHAFMRVHRSYIINLDKIREIEPWFNTTYQVTMTSGQKVPVSRSYIKVFRKKLGL
ncbi:LytR/AlgR family response regulator transcription factor [Alkalibacterium kapii]|uniref:Sensory transduction protein LytT n=1 Tax=Alkalibacterium kapii TaxID=426704 RepID=A0A511ASP4_9LACT|nr:LytTR family transcriptional regulator DNA-binding domain-containing protein [Alkalibacterium kapii]GEK91220.1 sensory transduction protein LytT [Alkalibacterium kapii]